MNKNNCIRVEYFICSDESGACKYYIEDSEKTGCKWIDPDYNCYNKKAIDEVKK